MAGGGGGVSVYSTVYRNVGYLLTVPYATAKEFSLMYLFRQICSFAGLVYGMVRCG